MKIAAVVVTYNRLDKLKKALNSFEKQTVPPDYLIIVNNGCTDDTPEYLENWITDPNTSFERIVITNPENQGGAGGFYIGMKTALELDANWIWVSDDDAYPEPDAFEKLRAFLTDSATNLKDIVTVCSSVRTGPKYELAHRRRLIPKKFVLKEIKVPEEEYSKDTFDLDLYSFVGAVFKREALQTVGFPVRSYFIHFDDSEHSLRMRKIGRIICVPAIEVYHDLEYDLKAGYQWKDYYLIRNRMDAIRRNFPKRYYITICVKRVFDLVCVWLGRDKTWARLFTAAVTDAWKGNLGLHSIYKPGWKAHE